MNMLNVIFLIKLFLILFGTYLGIKSLVKIIFVGCSDEVGLLKEVVKIGVGVLFIFIGAV